ncbi:MAG: glutathione S-transferase family protein [Pseudomonadota bacterium]|nr:glutathione S-transferase family protein [Pseudomonadota bacterium]
MESQRLILHHYDFSNFSEKIRLVLALKKIPWESVIIPSYLPKPDYLPLTAGYRRTPALQINSDIYCDTRMIVSILDSLNPDTPLYPKNLTVSDLAKCKMIEDWAETNFIRPIALFITGVHARKFPEKFHRDRANLHGKRSPSIERVERSADKYQKQVDLYLDWLNQLLTNKDNYFLGKELSITDLVLYEGPWFLKKIDESESFLRHRLWLQRWFHNVEELKYPADRDIFASEAIDLAFKTTPQQIEGGIDEDSQFKLGDLVKISAIGQNATAEGRLVQIDSNRISLASDSERTGSIHVHFPRLGYSVKPI